MRDRPRVVLHTPPALRRWLRSPALVEAARGKDPVLVSIDAILDLPPQDLPTRVLFQPVDLPLCLPDAPVLRVGGEEAGLAVKRAPGAACLTSGPVLLPGRTDAGTAVGPSSREHDAMASPDPVECLAVLLRMGEALLPSPLTMHPAIVSSVLLRDVEAEAERRGWRVSKCWPAGITTLGEVPDPRDISDFALDAILEVLIPATRVADALDPMATVVAAALGRLHRANAAMGDVLRRECAAAPLPVVVGDRAWEELEEMEELGHVAHPGDVFDD